MQLGVNIGPIERDNLGCAVFFRKTLQLWLESTPHATWKMLETAITQVLPVDYLYGIDLVVLLQHKNTLLLVLGTMQPATNPRNSG